MTKNSTLTSAGRLALVAGLLLATTAASGETIAKPDEYFPLADGPPKLVYRIKGENASSRIVGMEIKGEATAYFRAGKLAGHEGAVTFERFVSEKLGLSQETAWQKTSKGLYTLLKGGRRRLVHAFPMTTDRLVAGASWSAEDGTRQRIDYVCSSGSVTIAGQVQKDALEIKELHYSDGELVSTRVKTYLRGIGRVRAQVESSADKLRVVYELATLPGTEASAVADKSKAPAPAADGKTIRSPRDYFPLADGPKTLHYTVTVGTGGIQAKAKQTLSYTAATLNGKPAVRETQRLDPPGRSSTEHWVADRRGLVQLRGGEADLVTIAFPIVAGRLQKGATRRTKVEGGVRETRDDVVGDRTASLKTAGGSFTDLLHVRLFHYVDGELKARVDSWYARGVGLVKQELRRPGESDIAMEFELSRAPKIPTEDAARPDAERGAGRTPAGFCVGCGRRFGEGDRFCGGCGKKR